MKQNALAVGPGRKTPLRRRQSSHPPWQAPWSRHVLLDRAARLRVALTLFCDPVLRKRMKPAVFPVAGLRGNAMRRTGGGVRFERESVAVLHKQLVRETRLGGATNAPPRASRTIDVCQFFLRQQSLGGKPMNSVTRLTKMFGNRA